MDVQPKLAPLLLSFQKRALVKIHQTFLFRFIQAGGTDALTFPSPATNFPSRPRIRLDNCNIFDQTTHNVLQIKFVPNTNVKNPNWCKNPEVIEDPQIWAASR